MVSKKYYVHTYEDNKGDHEVHCEGCYWPPLPENRIDLGEFYSCQEAVSKARNYYSKVDGCKHCCEPCHKH